MIFLNAGFETCVAPSVYRCCPSRADVVAGKRRGARTCRAGSKLLRTRGFTRAGIACTTWNPIRKHISNPDLGASLNAGLGCYMCVVHVPVRTCSLDHHASASTTGLLVEYRVSRESAWGLGASTPGYSAYPASGAAACASHTVVVLDMVRVTWSLRCSAQRQQCEQLN